MSLNTNLPSISFKARGSIIQKKELSLEDRIKNLEIKVENIDKEVNNLIAKINEEIKSTRVAFMKNI